MAVASANIETRHAARAKGRNTNLDVIRGLSAIGVAYSHLIAALRNRGELDGPAQLAYMLSKAYFDIGKFAVLVLFALSGYFIMDSLTSAARRYERPVTAFAGQRFIRLYPLYWISLLFGVLFPWDGPQVVFSWKEILANITMLQGFFFIPNVVGLYWTLQIELSFYVICVVMFMLGWAGKIRMSLLVVAANLALAVLLAYARYAYDIKLPVALPLMVAVCFIGSMWKTSDGGRNAEAGREAWIAVACFYAALVPVCRFAYSQDMGNHETWDRYLLSYAVAMAVFLITTWTRRHFLAWIAPLGGVGYIIFLMHPSIFAIADRLGFAPSTAGLPTLVYIAIMIAIAIAIAFVIKKLILDPVLEHGAKVIDAVGRKRQR